MNNSGSGRTFDTSIIVPPEIKGWNWGAFLLGFFWSIGNQVGIGCCAPFPTLDLSWRSYLVLKETNGHGGVEDGLV